ncbi:MAG: DUF3179 domain-containing protein [Gemmatimonadetes bacterium]|nr:DUF3179 domain-containing protein [Gemmatimonadota bacterium]
MYSREIDGKVLSLEASGWTYRKTFVLYDRETGTLWYPLPDRAGLTGVAGPLEDRILRLLPSTRTTWQRWYERQPESGYMRYPGHRPR